MNYINPYRILKINAANLSDIDDKTILKEKKRLFQEIELSDTISLNFEGIELTKADCIRAVDELDNKDKENFIFSYLKTNL